MVGLKVMLQDLWDTQYNWDTELNERQTSEWIQGLEELSRFADVKIPRVMGTPDPQTRLHVFCDASANAYGCAIWLATSEGKMSFVQAKSMVAPIKTRTIPRLELLGAQLAARMLKSFRNSFGEVAATIWTDSNVVLHWIQTWARKFKAFVAARLQEIEEAVPDFLTVFKHIRGEDNPADFLTKARIQSPADLRNWLEGPNLESVKETSDHDIAITADLAHETKGEMKTEREKKKKPKISKAHVLSIRHTTETAAVEELSESCQTWRELLEAVEEQLQLNGGDAVRACLKAAQKGLATEGLWEDEKGLRRMSGRLGNSKLPEEVKFPVLLNGNSRITELFVKEAHEDAAHGGQKFLMNFLHTRRGVLVTCAKNIFQKIRQKCETCNEMLSKRETPLMGNLPPERLLHHQAPFTATGVDFIGSLPTVEKNLEIVIFTCLTSRVVHLELTNGKAEEDVKKAFRGLWFKRGVEPTFVLSDGAQSFVKARKNMLAERARRIDHPELTWEIAHPRAPHRRGAMEIMVKSVKRGITAMVGKQWEKRTVLEWEEIVTELNFLLNERPLMDGNERDHVTNFTGNSLLFPYSNAKEQANTNSILEGSKEMVKIFWNEWYTNMPAELFDRKKWKDSVPNIEIGDLVTVVRGGYGNDPQPRKYWRRGKVVETIESKDNVVRKVIVEYSDGRRERQIVQNLVVIERNQSKFD